MIHRLLLASTLATLAACGVTVSYTRSSSQVYPAKPENCALETLTVPPRRAFIELGTFDLEAQSNMSAVRSLTALLEQVRARACREGADAIVARKPETEYTQATALRWADPDPDPDPEAGAATPPAAPAPVAASGADPAAPPR